MTPRVPGEEAAGVSQKDVFDSVVKDFFGLHTGQLFSMNCK